MPQPTDNSPSSATHSQSSRQLNLFVQFEHYISGLLIDADHLSSVMNTDIKSSYTTALADAPNSPNVLWVVEPNWLDTTLSQADPQTAKLINDNNIIDIDVLFSQPLTTRYELICFWMPNVKAQEFQTYLPTFIRHRDMFALYTIAVLNASIDLHPYGFVTLPHTPIDIVANEEKDSRAELQSVSQATAEDVQQPSASITDHSSTGLNDSFTDSTQLENSWNQASKGLNVWQFNLYDYKPRPNWLNADYWANPENWDKYRW